MLRVSLPQELFVPKEETTRVIAPALFGLEADRRPSKLQRADCVRTCTGIRSKPVKRGRRGIAHLVVFPF